jgi:hypothetical protein
LKAREYIVNRETGEVATMYQGRLDGVEPKGQATNLGNPLTLDPGDVVLFPNKFMDHASGKKHPTHWGGANPGVGKPVVRIEAWKGKDRNERDVLLDETSYPIPGKSEAQMQKQDAERRGGNRGAPEDGTRASAGATAADANSVWRLPACGGDRARVN